MWGAQGRPHLFLAYERRIKMTQYKQQLRTITSLDAAALSRALVGFDRIISSKLNSTQSNYPPHNILKYNETNYGIELAVAGFSKEEIKITVDQNILSINGERTNPISEGIEFLHRGLAARNFVVEFPLAEFMEVREAEVNNGILRISVEYIVPDELKPRQIEIK